MFKPRGRSALGALLWWVLVAPGHAGPILINEFHYDNAGADTGEFIELAGVAGTALLDWSVVLYNGADGAPYYTRNLNSLAALMPDAGEGFGFLSFAHAGIQNGPDGIALVHGGVVEEFLSYEGVISATAGPAAGLTSIDIGVAETGSTPLGASLQRVGSGYRAEDFVWQVSDIATQGALNDGQRLTLPGGVSTTGTVPLSAGAGPVWLFAVLLLLARRRRGQAGVARRPRGRPSCTAAPGWTG